MVGRPGAAPLLGREWITRQQNKPMTEACLRANITGATFHSLRHTWASLSIMAGAPLMVVAQNLGHSDTRMVERCYGHLAKTFVADQIHATAPRFGTVEVLQGEGAVMVVPSGLLTVPEVLELIRARIDDDDLRMQSTPSPTEKGVVLLIAPDKKQAKVLLDYAEGTLQSTPLLS